MVIVVAFNNERQSGKAALYLYERSCRYIRSRLSWLVHLTELLGGGNAVSLNPGLRNTESYKPVIIL